MAMSSTASPFMFPHYTVRRAFLNLWHRKFRIYDPQDQLVMYSEMKALKLKEDIRVYSDEEKSRELLVIKARKILDISATYDVFDAVEQVKVGALRRKGLKSILRDEWLILDANDREFGKIQEDSMALALVRRFLSNLVPQSYTVEVQGQPLIEFKQNFNPFLLKLRLDFARDVNNALDRRLGLAAAVLLCAVEGRQQ